GGNLRGRILLAVSLDPGVAVRGADDFIRNETHVLFGHRVFKGAADQPLDGEKSALGIGDALTLGWLADEALAIIREGDNGRRGARALRVFDYFRSRSLHDRHAGIGGAKIDSYDFAHDFFSFRYARPPDPVAIRHLGGRDSRPVPDVPQIGI